MSEQKGAPELLMCVEFADSLSNDWSSPQALTALLNPESHVEEEDED